MSAAENAEGWGKLIQLADRILEDDREEMRARQLARELRASLAVRGPMKALGITRFETGLRAKGGSR